MIPDLRTLFITKEQPYPPAGGVELRNWQNISIMKQYGSVGIFSISQWKTSSEVPPGIDLWRSYSLDKSLSTWEQWERRMWLLRPKGHPDLDSPFQKAAGRELEKVMAEFNPNLVVIEELWLYRFLKLLKPYNCPVIFDEHNIEADLFEQKHGALKTRLPRLKAIESDFIRQADQTWVCSEEDATLLKKLYGEEFESYAIPNGINVAHYDDVRLNQWEIPEGLENKQENVLYMGTFSYPPNKVAAKLLIDEIFPRLQKNHPHCRLLMVGRSPTQFMLDAAKSNPGIIVTGSVPDVRPYLAAASVMVVPLQQGGGTRLKLLEAFASGCPAVSTSKGAEGLVAQDGEHLLIRDEMAEIVEAIEQLWLDSTLVEKLTAAAYDLVKAKYSWEATGKKVEFAIAQLF